MRIISTDLDDVKIIEPDVFEDERGFFLESWSDSAFRDIGLPVDFVQDNHSCSAKGVLRGLHYQISNPQGKLIRAVSGSIFDVAVDLRRNSAQFGAWTAVELSAKNKRMLWVPPGFGHGFLSLENDTQCLYKCTTGYAPQYERSLLWCDETIGIVWPLKDDDSPFLSKKDARAPRLMDAEVFK